MSRPSIRAAGFVLALLATACELKPPFARNNPLDEASDYDITLSGPDSTHSFGERITLSMHADPPLPDSNYAFSWVAGPFIEGLDTTDIAVSGGGGEFQVIDVRAQYRTIYLSAKFGRRHFAHRLVIGQKAVALDLSCSPWTQPFDPCDDKPFHLGDTVTVYLRMRDARGAPIVNSVEYALARGSVLSRDSLVVTPMPMAADPNGVIRVWPFSSGATWVIVRIDDATDSIRVAGAP